MLYILASVVLFTRETLPQFGGFSHPIAFGVFPFIVYFVFWRRFRNAETHRLLLAYTVCMEIMLFISGILHLFFWPEAWRLFIFHLDIWGMYLATVASFIPILSLVRHRKAFLSIISIGAFVGALLTPLSLCNILQILFLIGSVGMFFVLLDKRLPAWVILLIVSIVAIYVAGGIINAYNLIDIPTKFDSNESFHILTLVGTGLYLLLMWWKFSTHAPSS